MKHSVSRLKTPSMDTTSGVNDARCASADDRIERQYPYDRASVSMTRMSNNATV